MARRYAVEEVVVVVGGIYGRSVVDCLPREIKEIAGGEMSEKVRGIGKRIRRMSGLFTEYVVYSEYCTLHSTLTMIL